MVDCNNTEIYLSELNRMCNYYIEKDGCCKNCGLDALSGSFGAGSCELAARIRPTYAIALVQDWSNNHR